ncbi:MAG: site-specific integrase [Acidobacteriota bacterium]
MIEKLFVREKILRRYRESPFASQFDDFAAILIAQGYRLVSVRYQVRRTLWFTEWLRDQGIPIAKATQDVVARYVESQRLRPDQKLLGTLGPSRFMTLLRECRVIPAAPRALHTQLEEDLDLFGAHLVEALGVSHWTRSEYIRNARKLAAFAQRGTDFDWSSLTAEVVCRFVQEQAERRAIGGRHHVCTATRGLLRYLVARGVVSPALLAAVPRVRQWRLSSLPRYLPAGAARRALSACRDGGSLGLRDRAILTTLSRLGLRAGEVRRLRLDDVDWRNGTMLIRASKTQRERSVPLTPDVGAAIVAYLKKGRPKSADPRLFLRHFPPYSKIRSSATITHIARSRLTQAGVSAPHMGAHAFRHTVATDLVRHGVTFKDVADVLGHQTLAATGVYAKLDLATLARVAMPWPEEL